MSSTIIRYIDVPVSSAADRASMNNIRNLLFGFFVLGMFIGLISFFFGMSGAFDDFFTLVQVVFVHGFINLPANPPSLRVPMDGLSGVQFMNWLPGLARVAI